ncbi:hypothetical protein Unana1_04056 [Umbelopsis nana]
MQHASHVKDIGASDSSVGALSLPLEIWIEITKCFWDIHNVVRLLAVCKPLRSALLQSPQLWVKLNFNTEDLSTERHYPAPNMCNIMSFLNNLPSRSVQSIQWRPESSDAAKEIILYVMEKFEYIRELNIRPHLGNPSSQYLIAACEAVSELNQNGIQRRDFKQLLISNTSYRYEVADLKNCNRIMNKLQKGILALQGKPNAAHASSDIGPCHDLALCQVCKAQFARTCGKPICLACPNNSFKVCLSCSEYCSVCDQQVCPEHDEDEDEDEPDVEFLDGRCYHGDGPVLPSPGNVLSMGTNGL